MMNFLHNLSNGLEQNAGLSGIFFLLLIGINFSACQKNDAKINEKASSQSTLVIYSESDEDFVNPERGFYRYSETRSGNYRALSLNTLKNYRSGGKSSGAQYETFNSLVFRYFVMEDFTNSPISESYLQNVRNDFYTAREAGIKLIPRFTYTTSSNAGDCPEGFICPPYGDAPKEIILEHISQVGPILAENADVIHTVQMGFIGTWGENYYTDYFGDASPNADQGKYLDENWADRIEVLEALLDELPESLMVQVRYPQMKQRTIYGITARTNVAPLTVEEAFSGTNKARIAFHNDCLFASPADFGTYEDYGNSSTPRRTDVSNLKSYFAEDSKFVVVGGETCYDGYSPQNDCAPAGMADEDLRLLHYTYLNNDYNNEVNNDWVDGGCMEDIKKNLGYRLVLDSAYFPKKVSTSDSFELNLYIRNIGYASPIKYRPVQLVFEDESGENRYITAIDTDIRFWFDAVKIETQVDLPSGIEPGEYNLYLNLPDGEESIADRPEYAVRMANENLWEPLTGWNDLNHKVTIQ